MQTAFAAIQETLTVSTGGGHAAVTVPAGPNAPTADSGDGP